MTKQEYLSCVFENEDQFSAKTYQYINFNYPILRRFIFHVPNEGAKSKREGAKLQAMGVIAGIPDYICVKPLFAIELKMEERRNKKNGGLSDDQVLMFNLWKPHMPYCIAYNQNDIINFLNSII